MNDKSSDARVLARVTETEIDDGAIREAVMSDSSGALNVFYGVIRDHDAGEKVGSLDYSAHPDAEAILASLVRDEIAKSGLKIAAWHRIGKLKIGDYALVAAVSSAHRKESFETLQNLVERIKTEVPIWKRQHFASGVSDWVGL